MSDKDKVAGLALSALPVPRGVLRVSPVPRFGPWTKLLLDAAEPRHGPSARPPRRRLPPRTEHPSIEVGTTFRVQDATTGWIRKYRVLDDLGFDTFRVLITTGTDRRFGFRKVQRITSVLGGPTLAVLRSAGRI